MQSRYSAEDADRALDHSTASAPPALASLEAKQDLALRIYTSRLLGAEPELVLHGGGNTSVKTRAREYSGADVDCLCVKGSGWDLGAIEPAGFPICRLGPLLDLCRLEALSDADMVKALKSQMLDPSSPTPSVEALLHAYLPAKFVDHTHADAVLALVDQPDAEAQVRRVWGGKALFVPYIMPGFVLLKRVVELMGDRLPPGPIVLEKHGIFTWGDSAKESYERMIDAVTLAERSLRERGAALEAPASVSTAADTDERQRAQRFLGPILRGALTRAFGDKPCVVTWQDASATLALASHPEARAQSARGPLTPDHVIRTKQRPLFYRAPDLTNGGAARAGFEALLDEYRAEYQAYFDRGAARRCEPIARLDPVPRVILVPKLGALCVGSSLKAAAIVSDIYRHTARVILAATRLGSYDPVSEADLFDVEYWSLEQAKLKQDKPQGHFVGRVVLVTGAARGIGFRTAQRFLREGAHVVLTDKDEAAVRASADTLRANFGSSLVRALGVDVTQASDVTASVELAVDSFGGLDVVVSNAGTAPSGLLHETSGDAALRASLEVNLLGHQNVARAAAELFVRQGTGGVLLFNASKSAFNPGPEFGPYAVAKAALVALMKQYAVDLAPHRIRAGAVNADRIRTDLFGGGVLEARARARGISPEAYFQLNLLSRETTADDVADAFVWLARAEATTGAVLPVDGGNAAAFPR
jgi:rhamnose utilization protein RhaD (predicted bifunctional aldolase and dehydrogenase)/NAD(P)-dependent dehydrogenase (short-subunit alcohol dehydrogenase family)